MRKVILLMHVTLDGYVAGPNGEMDWILYDDELEKYAHDLVRTTDTHLFGRVTYQMMESYWPAVPSNPSSKQSEVDYANRLENALKVVFSKTLDKVEGTNSKLAKTDIAEEITELRQQPGKDMVVIGSPRLVHTLTKQDLIDEYWLNLNPVVLGQGIPLFKDVKEKIKLKLIQAKLFASGVVGLVYAKG